jgi:hypothetical protein
MTDRRQFPRCSPERRHVPAYPLPLRLPILVGVLALVVAVTISLRDAKAETVQGVTRDGRAFVQVRDDKGLPGLMVEWKGKALQRTHRTPLLEFCIYLTLERR